MRYTHRPYKSYGFFGGVWTDQNAIRGGESDTYREIYATNERVYRGFRVCWRI